MPWRQESSASANITVDGTAIRKPADRSRAYITMTLYGLAVAGAPAPSRRKSASSALAPTRTIPITSTGVDYGTPVLTPAARPRRLVKNHARDLERGLGSGLQEAGLAAPTVRFARRTGTIVIP